MRRVSLPWFFLLWPALLAAQDPPADDPLQVHVRLYRKVSPSIVFVQHGNQAGSGVIIGSDGVVLTSTTAIGRGAEVVKVVLRGHKELEGKVIGRMPEKELVLLKLDAKDLPSLEFADSSKAKVGQVSYTFGDSFHSIPTDDQVAMSLGIISGSYELTRRSRPNGYVGPVLETSAAVNPNQDGGALVDSAGKLVGLLTLAYDNSRFTGLAIPMHHLKPDIDRILQEFRTGKKPDPTPTPAPAAKKPGWIGLELEEVEDEGIRVSRVVAGGPAEKAGLKVGDTILRADSSRTLTIRRFKEVMERFGEGESLGLRVERDGKTLDFKVVLAKRPVY